MSKPMKILISGGRDFMDWAAVYRELSRYPPGTVLVHGDCRSKPFQSADRIAHHIGKALGFEVIPMPADWDAYGYAAGPIRNAAMVRRHSDADIAIVFKGGKGTRDFTGRAVRAHIPVRGGGVTDRTCLNA